MQKVLSKEFPHDHAFTVSNVANAIIVHTSSSMPDFSSVSSMSYSSTMSDYDRNISLSLSVLYLSSLPFSFTLPHKTFYYCLS
jgi:hypothetical protein